MNECTYKNYDELPLMLNVVQVAADLVRLIFTAPEIFRHFLLLGSRTLAIIGSNRKKDNKES